MPQVVHGVEDLRTVIRRKPAHQRTITISLNSTAESRFLLARLADVSATAEAIVHNPPPGRSISPWTRPFVVDHVRRWVSILRQHPSQIFVISPLDRTIVVQAIEGNPYFASMHDTDPRLTVEAVRAANAIRERFSAALAMPIARVPLGQGRRRL